MEFIRDAPLGQVIRWLSGNKMLLYPEEQPDFVLPETYRNLDDLPVADSTPDSPDNKSLQEDDRKSQEQSAPTEEVEKGLNTLETSGGHVQTSTEGDLEKATTRQSQVGSSIYPVKTKEGHILVSWYSEDDPENPQNWTTGRKIVATIQLYFHVTSVYLASSIVTPSFPGIMEQFGVSQTEASLLLAGYTLMYGWGSLPAASLSEIPSIGRNPPYMVTMGLFVAMSVALPLVNNYPGLVVLRFLQGFFGAPCLATGGASLADMWSFVALPYAICGWAVAATAGPSLGPLISGFSVAAENWRWSFWEILWLAGPVYIVMLCFLPETFAANLLLRKAQRIRKLTGDQRFKSQSELDQANMKPSEVARQALFRPFIVNALDPVVLYTTVFTAILYGSYYSYFESFPIVFERYNFDLGSLGLSFLSIAVGVAVAVVIYVCYLKFYVARRAAKGITGEPEERLNLGIIVCLLTPGGMLIFAWAGEPPIPWIVPLIGIFLFTVGVFIIIQLIFAYLPSIYSPAYVASIFAANNAARSSLAFAAILFATPMFNGIGVGGGVTLLAGIILLCCAGLVVLRIYGKALRARSRYTVQY